MSAMAIAVSPPGTPTGAGSVSGNVRPQSMYTPAISPEAITKSRPQSMMVGTGRSRSRLSLASSRGGINRGSDDDARTAVKVGT